LFDAPEKVAYLDQESHALQTHLEERLGLLWRTQVLKVRGLWLNILAQALEFLSKLALYASISNNNFQFIVSYNVTMTSILMKTHE